MQNYDLAERIAAVLNERRRIGEERRQRKYQLRQAAQTQMAEPIRGEPKRPSRRNEELEALCRAVNFSNAATDAIKEYGIAGTGPGYKQD